MKNIDINENKIVLKNLQTIRNKRNISQVKLATDIGVSQELISQQVEIFKKESIKV